MFVTCFAACWNLDSGELLYANAGHEPPLLFRLASKTTQALSCTGLPLGIEDQQSFPELSQLAQTGDILLAYTDGLSEARDDRGHQLEEASIETELHRCQACSAEEICGRMLKLSPEFDHQGLRDDVLIVAARYLGSGAFLT
jgi:serine phosphatase RsbU (regulator of sigma subunit)